MIKILKLGLFIEFYLWFKSFKNTYNFLLNSKSSIIKIRNEVNLNVHCELVKVNYLKKQIFYIRKIFFLTNSIDIITCINLSGLV